LQQKSKYIDYNDDLLNSEENEDKEILKSIEYAEKKLGSKMATPKVVKVDPHSPIKYDVESLSERVNSNELTVSSYNQAEIGDCDVGDEKCKKAAV
jgi:hypothetical protein